MRGQKRRWRLATRVFEFHTLRREYEGSSGFQIVGLGTLERWSWPGENIELQMERVKDACHKAKSADDPAAVFWLPKNQRVAKVKELRAIAYRQRHKPRRDVRTKLTFAQCQVIRSELERGVSRATLALRYRVSRTYIGDLANGVKRVNWGAEAERQPVEVTTAPNAEARDAE